MNIIINYLEGIIWSFEYYLNGCIDNHWFYKYSYSPTLHDIYNYCITNPKWIEETYESFKKNNKENTFKFDTLTQLLCVLPYNSKNLIPEKYQCIMTDLKYGCVHYYPTSFENNKYHRSYLHECTPIIPEIDVNKIIKAKKIVESNL